MPKIKANNITINYEQQGTGEPLLLIPYLAADNACYAFQVEDYAKQFTCISVDPRGAGESEKPSGTYSTELFADDIAAFIAAIGLDRVHVAGLSFGAAVGMWLAAKHPARVKSLSLHSAWTKSDDYLKVVVQGWQSMAKGLGSVTEMIIQGIFPWCFTPELYAARPELHRGTRVLRARPTSPAACRLPATIRGGHRPRCRGAARQDQGADADHLRPVRHHHRIPLRGHDEERHRQERMVVFEDCSHAPIYENVPSSTRRRWTFCGRQTG